MSDALARAKRALRRHRDDPLDPIEVSAILRDLDEVEEELTAARNDAAEHASAARSYWRGR